MVIEKGQDGRLETIYQKYILFLQVRCLHLQIAVIVDPHYFPVGEFVDVELAELGLNALQLRRNVADRHVLKGPVPTRQDLRIELDIVNQIGLI